MLPSALRTLSVLTLLSAVSGSVILTHQSAASGGASFQNAAFIESAASFSDREELQALRAQRPDAVADQIAEARAERIRIKKAAERKAREQRERRERQARQEAADRASRNARSNPQAMARLLLADRGWSGQFSCLNSLWNRESRWNYQAANPSSGAYGIPQALPGSKMSSAGSDWRTNPVTQMKWGLDYIADRYGSPCGAWSHSESSGWY